MAINSFETAAGCDSLLFLEYGLDFGFGISPTWYFSDDRLTLEPMQFFLADVCASEWMVMSSLLQMHGHGRKSPEPRLEKFSVGLHCKFGPCQNHLGFEIAPRPLLRILPLLPGIHI